MLMGASIYCAEAEVYKQFTIFDLSALKKQCLIYNAEGDLDMTHRKQILCVKLVTLFSIIALFSSSAFAADAADEHASKEATSVHT